MSNSIRTAELPESPKDIAGAGSHGRHDAPSLRQRLMEKCAFLTLLVVALVVVACALGGMIVARQE